MLLSGLDPAHPAVSARRLFARAIEAMPSGELLVLGHFDADGLAATAILVRALRRAGRTVAVRLVGKGENPWSPEIGAEVASRAPAGLIVTDLGVREGAIAPGVPAVLIDHHVPTGVPGDATVISGHGLRPEPTSALLAWWCAGAFADVGDLLWLAAMGLIGDMADGFPELEAANTRYGKTALKDAVSLVNAPRRTAAADASPALTLLLEEDGPKAITKGDRPEVAMLRAAKAEVAAELDAAKRVAPKVVGDVALIRFASPTQIHPLVAQQWRGRLKDKVVIAANAGYRPGWVHFAARTGNGTDLIDFLARHRPPGATEAYGSGHRQASGGALRPADWNSFADSIGFPDAKVPA
jgi:single-stranded-DNA-specific exonuclease